MEAELTSCAMCWPLTAALVGCRPQVTYTAPREPDCIVVGREEKGTLMFRRSGEHQALAPARPHSPDFRCDYCGGPLFVDEFDIVMVRSEKLEKSDERPRRGRPPKYLDDGCRSPAETGGHRGGQERYRHHPGQLARWAEAAHNRGVRPRDHRLIQHAQA